jgi:hypothetical protein
MVSASILSTKGCAAMAPDQLQPLPLKVSGRISPQQFDIIAAVGILHSQKRQS